MPALNYGTTRSFAGVKSTRAPQYASPSFLTPSAAAFGPDYTIPTASYGGSLAPVHGFGVALWTGVGAICLLVFVRSMLPN